MRDCRRRPAWTDRILYRVNVHNYEDMGSDIELDFDVLKYEAHPSYTCSDHKPVSMTTKTTCFGQNLAKEKKIFAYNPVIQFLPHSTPWFVNQDGSFAYTIDQNAGQILDSWDWVGLYHVSAFNHPMPNPYLRAAFSAGGFRFTGRLHHILLGIKLQENGNPKVVCHLRFSTLCSWAFCVGLHFGKSEYSWNK